MTVGWNTTLQKESAGMPTYVYKCDSCGAQFEQFQSFKDEPLRICPACAGGVRRVFQPVGIVFKGSGWYITDSRKSSSASISGEDSATGAEKPAGTAREAKPAESASANSKPADSSSGASTPATA
jgi:putative FmdB family regulatory protein